MNKYSSIISSISRPLAVLLLCFCLSGTVRGVEGVKLEIAPVGKAVWADLVAVDTFTVSPKDLSGRPPANDRPPEGGQVGDPGAYRSRPAPAPPPAPCQ